MGHVDKGGAQSLVQLGDLGAGLHAQLGVQVGKRLVHQKDCRVADDGSTHGHALPLATGKLLWLAVHQVTDAQDARRFLDTLCNLVLGGLAQLEAEGHVVVDRHVGVESVALEDHGDVTVFGSHVVDHAVANVDVPFGGLFQTG